MLKVRARIDSAEVDPQMRDRVRRWLVSATIREVLEGRLPDGQSELRLLIHSPARTFADADVTGKEYVLTLKDDLSDPYVGELSVT